MAAFALAVQAGEGKACCSKDKAACADKDKAACVSQATTDCPVKAGCVAKGDRAKAKCSKTVAAKKALASPKAGGEVTATQ